MFNKNEQHWNDRKWPTAETTAADRYGRSLGYCGRHSRAIGVRATGAGRSHRTLYGRPRRPARVVAADRRYPVVMPISDRLCRSRMTAARPRPGGGPRLSPQTPSSRKNLTAITHSSSEISVCSLGFSVPHAAKRGGMVVNTHCHAHRYLGSCTPRSGLSRSDFVHCAGFRPPE
jgi:hypothetical protein